MSAELDAEARVRRERVLAGMRVVDVKVTIRFWEMYSYTEWFTVVAMFLYVALVYVAAYYGNLVLAGLVALCGFAVVSLAADLAWKISRRRLVARKMAGIVGPVLADWREQVPEELLKLPECFRVEGCELALSLQVLLDDFREAAMKVPAWPVAAPSTLEHLIMQHYGNVYGDAYGEFESLLSTAYALIDKAHVQA